MPHAPPKWMQAIDSVTPVKAFALAVLLAAVNPKNLILTIGAAAGLGQLGLTTSASIVSIVVFVAIASVSIAGPVLYYLVAGASAKEHLDDLKVWLTTHNAAVMAVLFLVFGVLLIAKGIGLLST
jgi:Sap, sulfolipid-1-addressing protein